MSDRVRVGLLAFELSQETLMLRFGESWPQNLNGTVSCSDYRGDADEAAPWDYWMFRCVGFNEPGRREWYYYDLEPDRPPTIERARRVGIAPPRADLKTWKRAVHVIVDQLASDWRSSPLWEADSLGASVVTSNSQISVTLFLSARSGAPESLEVDQLSTRLMSRIRAELKDPDYGRNEATGDSLARERRLRIAQEVHKKAPQLAVALGRDSVLIADTAYVFSALRRAAKEKPYSEHRDLVCYVASEWLVWAGDYVPYLRAPLDEVLSLYGTHLTEDAGAAYYSGQLADSLRSRPWLNRWRSRSLVDWMNRLCDGEFAGEAWKEILTTGSDFLKHAPQSPDSPEVMLHMAEAHETAWSVGISQSGEPGSAAYRLDALRHRDKAIEFYESYLKESPTAMGVNEVRKRLYRLRENVDTGFRKYLCWENE